MERRCQLLAITRGNAGALFRSYDLRRGRKASSEMVAEVVRDQRMPPWYADPKYWAFHQCARDDGRTIRDKVVAWVNAGLPRGRSGAPCRARVFAKTEWGVSVKPDLKINDAYRPEKILPQGFIPYKYVILPYVFQRRTLT